MQILVVPYNFNNIVKELMIDIKNRLSILNPNVNFYTGTISIFSNIKILFRPQLSSQIKGMKPDYYWTDCYKVNDYFEYQPDVKELKTFTELADIVLNECFESFKQSDEKGGKNVL